MVYELWEEESGSYDFFERPANEEEYLLKLKQLELGMKLVWTVEASSWEEACQLLYDRKDFGRYRPEWEDLPNSSAPDPNPPKD